MKSLPLKELFGGFEIGSTSGRDEFFVRVALDFSLKVHELSFSYLTFELSYFIE